MNRFECRGVDGGVYRIEDTRVTEFRPSNGRLLQAQNFNPLSHRLLNRRWQTDITDGA
jgi:hypothetical protein